jgi:serine kinase of HPr protein (carbohydrate metabolism regulator)
MSERPSSQIHGTCVALGASGVVLRGPPGSGKSDLALRLIDGGARLVADDRIELDATAGKLFASAPATIKGLLEVRGLGVARMPGVERVRVAVVVDLVAAAAIERLPEHATCELLGVGVPRVRVEPFAASACAKVRLAAAAARRDILVPT